MNPMTPEQRETILENEKRKFKRLKIMAAAVLVPLIIGFLVLRIQVDHERVSGAIDSVSVKHQATGAKFTARIVLDRGDTVEALLPVTIPFEKGQRVEMTESTSLFGRKSYAYPRPAGPLSSQ